jgi:protein-S-isoprenylcysteine O-methyltransferase Ste14
MGNIASLLILMASVLIGLLRRVQVEEKALIEALGEQYCGYMQRTRGRFMERALDSIVRAHS